MSEPITSNKRIAQNTMFLYLRMLVSIIVNLYTVRLLWKVLGIDNYGIYNVVGGIVLMFAFLNNAMIASSQRFISFELGRGDEIRLRKTFSISVVVHFLLAIIVLILAETLGLWFLNNKMNIPELRMSAANWVYQCSIFTFILNVISVPYNACIIAHEHIKVFGYFGIIDVISKLVIVLITAALPFDRLISYAFLILILSAVMRIIYAIYCKKHFEECHFKWFHDKDIIKDMFAFAGWSFIGNMGFSVRDQGSNIILNMFFNVAVNAAKGIANQIGNVINGFASNFTMALNPQITKRFASGQIQSMIDLMMNGCKYALLLMSLIVIPLFFSAPIILKLWLGDVAPYTIGFLQLILIMSLVDCVVSPITTALQATGNIKKFQIIISLIMLSNLPLAWLGLTIYANPLLVIWISIGTSIIALGTRLVLLHELIPFPYKRFLSKVYGKCIPFVLIVGALSWFSYPLFSTDLIGLLGYFCVIFLVELVIAYLVVLGKSERMKIREYILNQIKKIC